MFSIFPLGTATDAILSLDAPQPPRPPRLHPLETAVLPPVRLCPAVCVSGCATPSFVHFSLVATARPCCTTHTVGCPLVPSLCPDLARTHIYPWVSFLSLPSSVPHPAGRSLFHCAWYNGLSPLSHLSLVLDTPFFPSCHPMPPSMIFFHALLSFYPE